MSTERRLLLVGNGWRRDGAPLLLLALARGYRAAGYHLTIAAPGEGPLREAFAALGETVSLPDWHGPRPRRSFLSAAARMTALAARGRVVAVVANTSQALAGVVAARALRLPCVWCVREGADPRELPFARWLERACGRGVDVVFEAEAVRRRWSPWLTGSSHVIPNGVPDPGVLGSEDRGAARAALGIPVDAEVVVSVGTVCRRKGQDVLVEAVSGLEELGLATYVVGGGEPLGYVEGVTWVGEVSDPGPWVRAADLVVSASREESHPRVVLEALAAARPLVATAVGGVGEQVADGREALLISPDDPPALAASIRRALGDPGLAARLARNGRARYETAFREERMVEAHVALLDRVLRRPGAQAALRRLLRGSSGEAALGRLARARAMVTRLGWAETVRAVGPASAPRRASRRSWSRPVPQPGDTPPTADPSCFGEGGDYRLLFGPGDVLEPDALDRLAAAIAEDPTRDVVYGDEVLLDGDDATRPVLKPQLCPELLLSAPYLGAPVAIRRGLVTDAASEHDLFLRAVEAARSVHRVPRVLCRRSRGTAPDLDAVRRALERRGLTGEVRPHPAVADALEVSLAPPPGTRVALIVPTRDRPDLLSALLSSLRRTTWPTWELVIVDNGSRDPGALGVLADAQADGAQVVVRDEPFDHSALCNAGAAAAGDVEVLCFLNDDVEVIARDWLEDLLALALSPGIGAVGARLVYPDGSLQHGGVVLGIGPDRIAGHAHLGEPAHSIGELGLTRLLGNASAVTGACLAVSRAAFEAIGGFDAVAFPTDYNDVDLCLRLREQGLRTAWTPRAELLHHGGASRARAIDPSAIEGFRARWSAALADDPCYHPLRTRARQDYGWDRPTPPAAG